MLSFQPRITCVVTTSGRVDLLSRSVNCYLKQSYRNRDMVIVAQGNCEQIRRYVTGLDRDDIQLFEASPKLCLGAMRNVSIEIATGELICQWDDDDLYHPDRLLTQYQVIRQSDRRLAAVYSDFLKYFAPQRKLYWCDWSGEPLISHRYLCGSIMFWKEAYSRLGIFYPQVGSQCRVEEDLNVLERFLAKGEVAPVFAGHQYIYVFHGRNTYDQRHHQLTLDTSWGKKVMEVNDLVERRTLLEQTFSLVGLEGPFDVCSKNGIAFAYGDSDGSH